jgi:hypothetical protein
MYVYVASVLFVCSVCFAIATHMFSSVSDVCCRCFSCFGHMLQVFHLDVSKVDQDATHIAMCPTCHNLLLQLLGRRRAWARGSGGMEHRSTADAGSGGRRRQEPGGPARVGEAAEKRFEWRGGEGLGKQKALGVARAVPRLCVQQVLGVGV